jgi:hypothetical protein
MRKAALPEKFQKCEYTRRKFISDSAALGAGLFGLNSFGKHFMTIGGTNATIPMPTINLGGFEVSRLILGSNPFWGFWHGNPQKPKDYTKEGRFAVMDAAASQGITAIWVPAYKEWISIWNEYKDHGGKLETWIGQPDGYNGLTVEEQITACAKTGGKAVCVQGMNVDEAIEKKDFEKLKRWIGMIKDYGLPAGLAAHNPESILKAEDQALPAEFYHLTLGVPDTFESGARDRTLKTVSQIDKPMVVFKVFGAGRFTPETALPYVMKAIRRKDGLCVGVDNPEQINENARLVRELTPAKTS